MTKYVNKVSKESSRTAKGVMKKTIRNKSKSRKALKSLKKKANLRSKSINFKRSNLKSKPMNKKIKRRKLLKKKRTKVPRKIITKSLLDTKASFAPKQELGGSKIEWIFGGWKKIQLRVSAKGNTYLDIRQWYPDDAGSSIGLLPNSSVKGLKPGKYGMCLLPFQFERLKNGLPDIEKQMKRKRAGKAINCGSTWNGPTIMVNVYKHNGEMVADLKEWYWNKKIDQLQPGGLKKGLREIKLKEWDILGLAEVIPEVEKALSSVSKEDIPKNTGGPTPKRLAWIKRQSKSSK